MRAIGLILLSFSLAMVTIGAWASSAQASDVVILPVLADPDIPQALRESALAATRAALEASGHSLRELPPNALEDLSACDEEDCAARARAEAAATIAVQVRLFHDPDRPGHARELVVTLFPEPDGHHTGRGSGEGDFTEWARAALAEARRAQQRAGAGPALAITGNPQGASVLLNGEVVGALDFRNPIDPGDHALTVRHPGYRSVERTVHVPDLPGHVERVHIELERDGGGRSSAEQVPAIVLTAAGAAAFVLGSAFLVGSAVQASEPAWNADEPLFAMWGAVAGTGLVTGIIGLILWLSDSSSSTANAWLAPLPLSFEEL